MLRETKDNRYHYFKDNNGNYQGEHKEWYDNGQLKKLCFYIDDKRQGEFKMWDRGGVLTEHCFFVDNKMHGEYKRWHRNGMLEDHCFYIRRQRVSFNELPYPETPEDQMFFKLKYNIPLLPVEQTC